MHPGTGQPYHTEVQLKDGVICLLLEVAVDQALCVGDSRVQRPVLFQGVHTQRVYPHGNC